jgi:hypothetical protein
MNILYSTIDNVLYSIYNIFHLYFLLINMNILYSIIKIYFILYFLLINNVFHLLFFYNKLKNVIISGIRK